MSLIELVFLFLTYITFVLPRSFSQFKLVILVSLLALVLSRSVKSFSKISVIFYIPMLLIGLAGASTGLIYGNPFYAILDGLRLYLCYPIIFIILNSMICRYLNINYLLDVLSASVISILIINVLLLIEAFYGVSIFTDNLRSELLGNVGIHDVYIQITSHNIGSLFFLCGFYLVLFSLKHPKRCYINIVLISAILGAGLSGRRALWLLIVFLMPILILHYNKINKKLFSYLLLMSILIVCFTFFYESDSNLLLAHVSNAFGEEDERYIQSLHLIKGYLDFPLLGSGFGGTVDYIRSIESPWVYENSFLENLFHFGTFFTLYYYATIFYFIYQSTKANKPILQAVGYGAFLLVVSTWSNPYLGSFDFLFQLNLLPLCFSFFKYNESNNCNSCVQRL